MKARGVWKMGGVVRGYDTVARRFGDGEACFYRNCPVRVYTEDIVRPASLDPGLCRTVRTMATHRQADPLEPHL